MAINSTGPVQLGGTTSGVSIAQEASFGTGGTTTLSMNDTLVRQLNSQLSGAVDLNTSHGKTYVLPIRYLVVAGGGGGNSGFTDAWRASGAGGGGGMIQGTVNINRGTFTATVGAGGSALNNNMMSTGANVPYPTCLGGYCGIGGCWAYQGNPSSLTGTGVSVSTTGGGGGGGADGGYGGPGGSGGGGAWVRSGGAGTAGQGYNGGGGNCASGGGGGGAGGAGGTPTGGPGAIWSVDGNYYAGGGGGNCYGAGGAGGGGSGSGNDNRGAGSGVSNTGGGGGAGGRGRGGHAGAGNGGSGVVKVAYAREKQILTGGTVTTSGGYYIHTFTSTGNFSW